MEHNAMQRKNSKDERWKDEKMESWMDGKR